MSTITTDALLAALASGYRFRCAKGTLSTEGLFALPLNSTHGASLNAVAQGLHSQITDLGAMDFVGAGTSGTKRKDLEARLDIVKAVIRFKQDQNAKAKAQNDKRKEKEFLQNLLNEKEIDQLKGLSVQEIKNRLASL